MPGGDATSEVPGSQPDAYDGRVWHYTARMLNFTNVALRRGARKLLDDVSLTIYPGWKLGVVGRNGTGKSSLFALVLGQLATDRGEVSLPKNVEIASVAQETPALPLPAIDYVLDGDAELRLLERTLVEAEAGHDINAIAHCHDRLNAIGGYAARARAGKLLHGLGFSGGEQEQAVADFSGGWRMRLNLARALMCRSELLLLDEPTNHLDLDAVIWLQDWLIHYPGTLLLISHDREFLDAVCSHTLHLEGGGAVLYSGNYSQFERLRAEKLAQQGAAYEQQSRRMAHLQSFVDRFRAQATKARQAQARIKMIEKMTLAAPAHLDSEFSFEFLTPERLPSPMIQLDGVRAGYAGKPILGGIKRSIQPGDRIGLLGPNGAGKSTLVRTLAGELAAQGGELKRDPYLKIGYFAQHQLEQLDPAASAILHLKRLDPAASEQALRDFLGGFNFRGDRALEAIAPFSGGEKARLALALVVYRKPNLLLLDEPTNHLDLDMRHALELALQAYAGAVVLVSHDRHLLSTACDQLWLVADGRCQDFDGDLDDYARWLVSRHRAPDSSAAEDSGPSARDQRRSAAERRQETKPLRDRQRKLDQDMQKLSERLAEIEAALADPALYEDAQRDRLSKLVQEQGALGKRLGEVEEQWLEVSEQLEA